MTEFTPEWIAEQRKIIDNLKQEEKECWDAIENFPTVVSNSSPALIAYKSAAKKYYRKALDHIERQAKRIEELEQERRWIPVSERLPEDSRIYDVAIAGYEYSWTGTCVFGKWIGESGKAILGITHWKYRPQPPQEETK